MQNTFIGARRTCGLAGVVVIKRQTSVVAKQYFFGAPLGSKFALEAVFPNRVP